MRKRCEETHKGPLLKHIGKHVQNKRLRNATESDLHEETVRPQMLSRLKRKLVLEIASLPIDQK